MGKMIEEIDKKCECVLLFMENFELYIVFGFKVV